MDYTTIPRQIRQAMAESGEPLTDDQYSVLVGCIAAFQILIEIHGLENAISEIELITTKLGATCRNQ